MNAIIGHDSSLQESLLDIYNKSVRNFLVSVAGIGCGRSRCLKAVEAVWDSERGIEEKMEVVTDSIALNHGGCI